MRELSLFSGCGSMTHIERRQIMLINIERLRIEAAFMVLEQMAEPGRFDFAACVAEYDAAKAQPTCPNEWVCKWAEKWIGKMRNV